MSGRGFRSFSSRPFPYTPIRSASANSNWSFRSIPSSKRSSSTDSSVFWKTPPKSWRASVRGFLRTPVPGLAFVRQYISSRRMLSLIVCVAVALLLIGFTPGSRSAAADIHALTRYTPIRPVTHSSGSNGPDPLRWLERNSDGRHAVSKGYLPHISLFDGRPRAALISLVRNSELKGMIHSMQQLEYRWNRKYQYPWIFFNDEPFTEEFKAATRNLTSAKCYYKVVPKEHWSLPSWIDESRFMNSLEYLGTIGVGKGWMVSYHHMCRWNSGFFYKHPFLGAYDWYWRVEPDVHYFCNIDYDVFRFMRDNNLKYGFNMNILDDARSFPSLWSRTRAFAAAHSNLINPDADVAWLLDNENGGEYNNCQFFSNFEIGSLNFWRGDANEAYFDWLDKAGGFYYERFGDAPVHTLSVAMFLPKSEIWFFRDIGYQHDINHHCPPHREGKCSCEPTRMDENFYKLVPLESPQKKPADTCIRQFLGGDWLKKKEGWTMAGEKAYGGDGYHGYEILGDE
ncbi:related to alpha-1,2-mannosyltransferase [Rhynchosporium agropyri]|uniref:Related to alpha-1,2-mannosyltransferase n=1 Tax=Rhynchosporium agropyri TaxID=914238 RepID=A0A1E1LBH7_9HELO|nr:related to alpha-1,2-mannosyltransferase [Rhynchosporium agropyri]